MNPRRKSSDDISRRHFLLRSSCAAMGLTSMVNTLAQLKLMQGSLNAQGSGTGYKALVCIFLNGGNDSNNLLVPRTGNPRVDYVDGRGILALPINNANPLLNIVPLTTDPAHIAAANPYAGYLDTSAGVDPFGLHPQCGAMRDMFNGGDLAFVANVGTLTQPGITRANYTAASKPPQLFSHSDQQVQWQSSVPDRPFSSGWGGRVADLIDPLNNPASGNTSMSISIAGVNSFQVSATGQVTPYVMTSGGVQSLSGYGTNYTSAVTNPSVLFNDGNYRTNEEGRRLRAFEQIVKYANNSLMENAYNSVVESARLTEGQVGTALADTAAATTVTTKFADAYAGAEAGLNVNNDFTNQMKLVARLIAGRASLGNSRQIFFVQLGGFDTHTTQIPTSGNIYSTGHTGLMNTLSRTLKGFRDSLVDLGVWDNVVAFSASDFTRTFTANKTDSSAGSDHAWGGHAFVLGGPVTGGRIYGKFPPLKRGAVANSIDATGNSGRWIPSTSVDQYAAVLASWLGVSTNSLGTIFPNLGRFTAAPYGSILQPGGSANLGFIPPA